MAYTCASGVCKGSDAATTQAIQLLQRTVNRFATDPDIGFTPLSIDGVVGTLTTTATQYALSSINLASDPVLTDTHLQDVAGNLIDMINSPTDLMQTLTDATNVVDTGASLLGRPPLDATPPSSGSNPKSIAKGPGGLTSKQASVLAKNPGMAAGAFLGLPFNVPNWAVYGGIVGIVGLVGRHYYKRGSFKRFGYAPKTSSKR